MNPTRKEIAAQLYDEYCFVIYEATEMYDAGLLDLVIKPEYFAVRKIPSDNTDYPYYEFIFARRNSELKRGKFVKLIASKQSYKSKRPWATVLATNFIDYMED